jgi:hypothetical protein
MKGEREFLEDIKKGLVALQQGHGLKLCDPELRMVEERLHHIKVGKPTLGVEPADIWIQKRRAVLACAIIGRLDANQKPSIDWAQEYNELTDKLKEMAICGS